MSKKKKKAPSLHRDADIYSRAELACRLIERASFVVPQFAQAIRQQDGVVSEDSRLRRTMTAIEHLLDLIGEIAPDEDWFRDYYTLTGDHMVLTDEGWVPADQNTREVTGEDPGEVLDEVNAPQTA